MSGRPFLQIPGPTNVPDRILRAMDRPVIDHRGPEFAALTHELLPPLRRVFGTREGHPILYPASGTGAWEAALVNVLAPGDRVLAFNHGHFSAQFAQTARDLGYQVDEVPLRWGQELPPDEVAQRLRADRSDAPYKAVLVVQNETSTGVLSDVGGIRQALDAAGHDALLIVDAVSSLASTEFKLDEWRVDVALAGSQKGLMLPPGLALLCIGPRAREVSENGGSPRHFFDWRPILRDNAAGFFPYTPATLLLFGLREALRMLVEEEGLERVYARHRYLAAGVRQAVAAWGLPLLCERPAHYSPTLTAVVMPGGAAAGGAPGAAGGQQAGDGPAEADGATRAGGPAIDADAVIRRARERFGLALGVGLGRIKGKVLRIGHLGALNELEVLGTLGGVELALRECGVPLALGAGVAACQEWFVRPAGDRAAGQTDQAGHGRAERRESEAAAPGVPVGRTENGTAAATAATGVAQ